MRTQAAPCVTPGTTSPHAAVRVLLIVAGSLTTRTQAWAKRNRIRMDIRLDHGVGDEQYEEFIAFHSDATPCFLLLWRDENVVFAQPMPGRRLRFPSVFAALSRLHVKQGVAPAS